MTKFLLILIPGIILFILSILKNKYRAHITVVFVSYVIVMNIAYNYRNIGNMLTFIKPVNQLIYQESYMDTKQFPDAFLQLIIDGKTVYTKADRMTFDKAEEKGYYFLYAFYHARNPVFFMEHYGATVVMDENINNAVINRDKREDFKDIGYANDMLRNVSMFYPSDDPNVANYFIHQWYFNEYTEGMHLYVNFEGINDADELVMIWQPGLPGPHEEDFYLMTKDYYDRNFK